jgi:hypothetical protein
VDGSLGLDGSLVKYVSSYREYDNAYLNNIVQHYFITFHTQRRQLAELDKKRRTAIGYIVKPFQ